MKNLARSLLAVAAISFGALAASAQGTAFSYQGFLTFQGAPANGAFDLQFAVFDAATSGAQQGLTVVSNSFGVTNGLFALTIDPGANVFTGAARWLNIAVRPASSATFTNVVPRQPLAATPYAIFAGGASAAGLTGTLPSASLAGTYGGAVNFSNTANTFAGGGGGLTNLNGGALTSGTVADARLSANVALRAGGNAFTGNQTVTSGSIGLGPSSPGERLMIEGGNAFITGTNVGAPGADGALLFGSDATTRDGALLRATGGDLAFWRYNGAWNQTLRLQNSSGNVGIGTASPSAKLHVGAGTRFTSADIGSIFLQSGTGGAGAARDWKIFVPMPIGNLTFRDMGFDNLNNGMTNDALVIQAATGFVGIGKSNPVTALDVSGTVNIDGGNAFIIGSNAGPPGVNGSLLFGSDATTRDGALLRATGGDLSFWRYNGAWNESLRIVNTSGNVGIGSTSPSAKLHVGAGTRFTSADIGSIFLQSGTGGAGAARDWKIFVPMPIGNLTFRDMGFDNLNNGMTNDALVIQAATGFVGIGKSNPATALDVNGTVNATAFTGDGAGLTLNAGNLTNGTVSDARLSANVALRSGGNAFTGNQTVTSGSVGIGPSAPTESLLIDGGNAFITGINAGAPGANGAVMFGSDATTRDGALLRATGGDLSFWRYNGAWNETLRLANASGNVGIGKPNPATALDVNGTVTATAFAGLAAASNLTGTVALAQLPAAVVTNGSSTVITNNVGVVVAGVGLPVLSLAFPDANLIAAGYSNAFTVDGVGWTAATTNAAWQARQTASTVVFSNLLWVMGGYGTNVLNDVCGTNNLNDVWSSTNGANWVLVTNAAAFPGRYSHQTLVFSNRMWVLGGIAVGNIVTNDVWSSTNGSDWVRATPAANWARRYAHTSLVHSNKMWVMGGTFTGVNKNDVWSSTDGTNWTQATGTATWSARSYPGAVEFDSKMWVLGGIDSAARNDVYSSTDGAIWTLVTGSANWPARYAHTTAAFNGTMWVLGGTGAAYRNDVWSAVAIGEKLGRWYIYSR
ncbi:MAG: hypothetical protein HY301_01125 [Verrucomicrobia bacterium]|nr:hypothetical protein [Verrucomicrobiota bacterium]